MRRPAAAGVAFGVPGDDLRHPRLGDVEERRDVVVAGRQRVPRQRLLAAELGTSVGVDARDPRQRAVVPLRLPVGERGDVLAARCRQSSDNGEEEREREDERVEESRDDVDGDGESAAARGRHAPLGATAARGVRDQDQRQDRAPDGEGEMHHPRAAPTHALREGDSDWTPGRGLQQETRQIHDVARPRVGETHIKRGVVAATPVGQLEGQVEGRRADDEHVVAEQLLRLVAVTDDDAEVRRTCRHLTWRTGTASEYNQQLKGLE